MILKSILTFILQMFWTKNRTRSSGAKYTRGKSMQNIILLLFNFLLQFRKWTTFDSYHNFNNEMFTIPLYNVVTCEYNEFYVLFTRTYVTSVLQSSSIQNMTFIETATLHSSFSYIITHKRHDELIIFHIF